MFISLPPLHNHDVKFPYTTFFGQRKHMTTEFFLFFLNVGAVPKNLTSGKYAYVNPFKFKKTLIHFNSDVFAAVPIIVASHVDVFALRPRLRLNSHRQGINFTKKA